MESMPKWEYLEYSPRFSRVFCNEAKIVSSQYLGVGAGLAPAQAGNRKGLPLLFEKIPKINDMANAIKVSFPGSKLKVKGDIEIKDVWYFDLMNFLGSQGWELVSVILDGVYPRLWFKRPFPD
jgi:hypothetical protein